MTAGNAGRRVGMEVAVVVLRRYSVSRRLTFISLFTATWPEANQGSRHALTGGRTVRVLATATTGRRIRNVPA